MNGKAPERLWQEFHLAMAGIEILDASKHPWKTSATEDTERTEDRQSEVRGQLF